VNYGALAPLYDRIMSHVGYHQWLALIDLVVDAYGGTPHPTIFELGGGTGVLGRQCADAGFSYTGSDLSKSMCRQAARRGLPFFCADAKHLPLKPDIRFDMVLFLYDGINYCMTASDYQQVFSEVHAHLNVGGLFLFDITTVFNSETNFSEYVDADDLGDSFYFRHSYYDNANGIQHNDFTIFSAAHARPNLFEKSLEHHRQKVFPVGDVRDFIPETLFEIVGVWDNFSLRKYTSRSERVHFLLRKKGEA
jgi:ubiquinone/menaquinone biosynthesis C-methylase UbiE